MPLVSKTVEIAAEESVILGIVADFEAYPQWNEEVRGCWILHRYDDGRPSQLRLDTSIQGNEGIYIQAVYYPQPNQIQTVMQQGDHFSKQEQLFAVVGMGPVSLLTVDMDVELAMAVPVPAMMVKKVINEALEHLAGNLKKRAEDLAQR